MKQRLREFDYLRAFAALSIIAIHITATYCLNSRPSYYINQAVRFAVPIFLLISGYLLNNSNADYSGFKGYIYFISKRLKKIYIPYLIWTLIYIIFCSRYNLESIWLDKNAFLLSTARKILFGTGYAHLYFIIIIIQMYFLFPLLKYLLSKWRNWVLMISFIITLIFQTIVYLRSLKIISIPDFVIPRYMFFPTWVFFFVFGMYFALNSEWWRKRLNNSIFPIVTIWLISFAVLVVDSKYTGTYDSSIKPTVILYCLTTFFLFYTIFNKFIHSRSMICKALDWISVQSFLIYFSHLLIKNIIIFVSNKIGAGRVWNGTIGMIALYSATLLFTCLFSYIISFIPIAEYLGGAVRKKKAAIIKNNSAPA